MSKTIQQKMHEQHIRWQREHETWLADIDKWKKQVHAALSDLADVQGFLRDSADALEDHANTIWESQQRLTAHELAVSEEARLGEHKTDKAWADTHSEHAAQHERTAEAHERIKKHHHEVLAEAGRLLDKVRQAL